jgi:hypothetical protein
MKQYQAIELRTQWMFILKAMTFKEAIYQVEKQLGYKPQLQLVAAKRIH